MLLKKKQNLLYFILSLSLFVSLYFQENSSGGSKLDSIITKHYIDYFQIGLSEGLNYFIKHAIHSPVFYIIVAKTKLLFGNHLSFIIYVIISATLPLLFYNLLKKKFIYANREYLFFLSLLIFLSPYFRSSAAWLTNDNFAIILFCLSLKYFLKIKNKKDSITINFFLCFVFLSLAAYIRQYYGFFIIIYFIELIKQKNLYLLINCILLNLILSLPFLYYSYYLYIEHNSFYVSTDDTNNVNIINSIIFVFSIIFIYLFPFIVSIKFEFQNIKNYILKNVKLILLISIFTFVIIFWNNFGVLEYGGGAIYKFTKKFSSYQNFTLGLIFGVTSIFLATLFEKNFINYIVILLLCLISFDFVFQKYYDPLVLILFFTLIESKKINELINNRIFDIKIIYLFYLIFLISANIYYS